MSETRRLALPSSSCCCARSLTVRKAPRRLSNMRNAFAAVLLVATAVAGCAHKQTPDEFAVARNAPLIVPPDFSLGASVAGTAGITAGEAQQQAVDALSWRPAPRPLGEMSRLDVAGRDTAQLGIRLSLGDCHKG